MIKTLYYIYTRFSDYIGNIVLDSSQVVQDIPNKVDNLNFVEYIDSHGLSRVMYYKDKIEFKEN